MDMDEYMEQLHSGMTRKERTQVRNRVIFTWVLVALTIAGQVYLVLKT